MSFITLSGRRWKTHGSSKESSGKEAGSKKASQKGGTKEEIISSNNSKTIFCDFFMSLFRITEIFYPYPRPGFGIFIRCRYLHDYPCSAIDNISIDTPEPIPLQIRRGERVKFSRYRPTGSGTGCLMPCTSALHQC